MNANPKGTPRLSGYLSGFYEFQGNILQPDDILDPVLDIETGRAGDPANAAFLAGPARNASHVERVPGLPGIPVSIGVHIAAHQGWDIQVIRTLWQARPALLAVETGFRPEARQVEVFELLIGHLQVPDRLQVPLQFFDGRHPGNDARDMGILKHPFQGGGDIQGLGSVLIPGGAGGGLHGDDPHPRLRRVGQGSVHGFQVFSFVVICGHRDVIDPGVGGGPEGLSAGIMRGDPREADLALLFELRHGF